MKNYKPQGNESRKEWEALLWEQLVSRLAESKSAELKKNLDILISEDERRNILIRAAIIALISEGKSYKEISALLWVSPATISVIKKNIFGKFGSYKNYRLLPKSSISRIESGKKEINKSLPDIFSDIDLWELIKNPPRPPGIGIIRARR